MGRDVGVPGAGRIIPREGSSIVANDTILVAGTARSGSTLLGMMLGSQQGVLFVGESCNWGKRWKANGNCGCGDRLHECQFWSSVMRMAATDVTVTSPDGQDYVEAIIPVLTAARRISGARVLVDSSKKPEYLEALARHPEVRPIGVHIVRDPRGVLVSAHRGWKQRQDPAAHPPLSKTIRLGMHWRRRNRACARLLSRIGPATVTVRYEDLVADPDGFVSRLCGFAGVEASRDATQIGRQHVFCGNPVSYTRDEITLELDSAWQRVLPRHQQHLVIAAGWPMTADFGYSARWRREDRSDQMRSGGGARSGSYRSGGVGGGI